MEMKTLNASDFKKSLDNNLSHFVGVRLENLVIGSFPSPLSFDGCVFDNVVMNTRSAVFINEDCDISGLRYNGFHEQCPKLVRVEEDTVAYKYVDVSMDSLGRKPGYAKLTIPRGALIMDAGLSDKKKRATRVRTEAIIDATVSFNRKRVVGCSMFSKNTDLSIFEYRVGEEIKNNSYKSALKGMIDISPRTCASGIHIFSNLSDMLESSSMLGSFFPLSRCSNRISVDEFSFV